MACANKINLNKSNSDICGDKGGKCELIYDYAIDKCTVSNKTKYLELKNCAGKSSFVSFGGGELSISKGNVRIYTPAIHNIIDGSKDNNSNSIVAEAIIHYKKTDGSNLLICIPIRKDDTVGVNDFWEFLDTVKPKGTETPVDINTKNFTLNKLVKNCPFYLNSDV